MGRLAHTIYVITSYSIHYTKLYELHQTIQKVEHDIENLKFNTGISALMVFNNLAIKKGNVTKETAQTFASYNFV